MWDLCRLLPEVAIAENSCLLLYGSSKEIGVLALGGGGAISGRTRCGQPWAHKARAALGAQAAKETGAQGGAQGEAR